MTPEQLEEIKKAAGEAATKAVEQYNSTPNEHMKKLMDDAAAQAKSIADVVALVKAGEANVERINGQLVKFAKATGQVSLIEMGVTDKEVKKINKAKMYRGMIRNIWDDAGLEKEVAIATRQKAIAAGDPASGGYYIPVELSTDIVELIRNTNVLTALGVTNVNPMRSRFEIPTVTSGTTASFIGEAQELSESDMKFGILSMDPKKLAVLAYASREMIDAADPAIVQIIESDIASATAEKLMWAAMYGNNAANTPLGLTNMNGIKTYEPGTTGDDPSKTNFRAIRAKVAQKYNVNPSFAFLMNENVLLKAADLANTAAPDASYLLDDATLVNKIAGKPVFTTGVVRADKSKSTGNNLGDVFYGPWNQFIQAIWWGGLRMESTTEGGKAFANDLVGFKSIVPVNYGARRPEAFVHAKFMKSILST